MKKSCLIIFFLLALTNAKSQQWQWMTSLPDTGGLRSALIRNHTGDVIARQTTWQNGYEDFYSVLTNVSESGVLNWNKKYSNLFVTDFTTDSLDNIYFSGNFIDTIVIDGTQIISQGTQDGIVVKLNKNGQLIHYLTFATDSIESCNGIYYLSNKIYLTGGSTKAIHLQGQVLNANTTTNLFMTALDTGINVISTFQTSSDSNYSGCEGKRVHADENGNVYLLGNASGFTKFKDSTYYASGGYFIMKMDANNNAKWFKGDTYYDGSMIVPVIKRDSHGNIIVLYKDGGGGGAAHQVILTKYDSTGNVIYNHWCLINAATTQADRVFMDLDEDNTVYIAGQSYTYAYGAYLFALIKIKEDSTHEQLFFDPDVSHSIRGLAVKSENDLFIYGICSDSSALGAFTCNADGNNFVAHYGNTETKIKSNNNSNRNINIFPNPSTGIFTLQSSKNISSIEITNLIGERIYTAYLNSSQESINLSSQPKGIYFVEIICGDEKSCKKIIIE